MADVGGLLNRTRSRSKAAKGAGTPAEPGAVDDGKILPEAAGLGPPPPSRSLTTRARAVLAGPPVSPGYIVTHGTRGPYRQGPPVDIGVNTDPLPPPPLTSMYIAVWMLINLLTGLLCYVEWFRHQNTERKAGATSANLPRAMTNAFIAFWVLGAIIYFGVALPVLFSTLNREAYPIEVRNKRYFATALLWALHDFPLFVIEFDAFVKLGLMDGFQAASFAFTMISGIIPPWYIYLRVTTDRLHAAFDHHARPGGAGAAASPVAVAALSDPLIVEIRRVYAVLAARMSPVTRGALAQELVELIPGLPITSPLREAYGIYLERYDLGDMQPVTCGVLEDILGRVRAAKLSGVPMSPFEP